MNKNGWLFFAIIIIAAVLIWFGFFRDQSTPEPVVPEPPTLAERVIVDEPSENDVIESPLSVSGEAPGNWFFEASFPIRLLDATGSELTVAVAQAQSEWMTTEQVPFVATLTFAAPATDTGTLVLERDNPSGLPENDAKVVIPIRFR